MHGESQTDLFSHKHSVVQKLSLKHGMKQVQQCPEMFLTITERHNDGDTMTRFT